MLKKISHLLHPFGLIATGIIILYLVQGGGEGSLLMKVFADESRVQIAWMTSLIFLALEIPFTVFVHIKYKSGTEI